MFFGVFVAHALYMRHNTSTVPDGWADSGLVDSGFLGLGPYIQAQDYFLGLAYAVGAAFTVWSLLWEFSRSRKRAAEKTGRVSWENVLFHGGIGFLPLVGCLLPARLLWFSHARRLCKVLRRKGARNWETICRSHYSPNGRWRLHVYGAPYWKTYSADSGC